jgi:hypothetical protein
MLTHESHLQLLDLCSQLLQFCLIHWLEHCRKILSAVKESIHNGFVILWICCRARQTDSQQSGRQNLNSGRLARQSPEYWLTVCSMGRLGTSAVRRQE